MSRADTARICQLNDAFRRAPELIGLQLALDQLVVTRGVAARGRAFVDRAVRAVREYGDFTPDNDPYAEHDFGAFRLDGDMLFWKIDYHDLAGQFASPDPSDPLVTRRVLIMLAEEY